MLDQALLLFFFCLSSTKQNRNNKGLKPPRQLTASGQLHLIKTALYSYVLLEYLKAIIL